VAESITQHKNGSILFCPAPSKKEEDLGGGKDDDVKFKSTTKTLTLKLWLACANFIVNIAVHFKRQHIPHCKFDSTNFINNALYILRA
jgi:hypothetical protein